MEFLEAVELVKGMNLAEPDSLTFKAGVLIFYCTSNGIWDDVEAIDKATGYGRKDIQIMLNNFYASEIVVEGELEADFDDEYSWMEFILMAMAGAGEVVRYREQSNTGDVAIGPEIKVREGMRTCFGSLQSEEFYCKI